MLMNTSNSTYAKYLYLYQFRLSLMCEILYYFHDVLLLKVDINLSRILVWSIYVMPIWEYCSNKYDLIIGNKNCISILQRKTQTTVILRYSLLVSWSKMVMKTICNEIIYRSIEIEESLGKYQRAARSMSSFQ